MTSHPLSQYKSAQAARAKAAIRAAVFRNPFRSQKEIANELGISTVTVWKYWKQLRAECEAKQ